MTGRDGVQLSEDLLLDLHPLGYRLDHEVDVAEALIDDRSLDPIDHLLHLGLRLLLGQLASLDQARDLALGDFARLQHAGLDQFLVYVLEHNGDAGCGDRLGDLTAHRACPDHGSLEHEHASRSLLSG